MHISTCAPWPIRYLFAGAPAGWTFRRFRWAYSRTNTSIMEATERCSRSAASFRSAFTSAEVRIVMVSSFSRDIAYSRSGDAANVLPLAGRGQCTVQGLPRMCRLYPTWDHCPVSRFCRCSPNLSSWGPQTASLRHTTKPDLAPAVATPARF